MDRFSGTNYVTIGGLRFFVDLNLSTNTPGSFPNALWMNGVQESIMNVVEAGGLVPTDADNTQMLHAIETLIADAVGGGGGPYAALAGSSTQVFSVANATTADEAVNLGQLEAATGTGGVFGALTNETGSRSGSTVYTNSTGKPIAVFVEISVAYGQPDYAQFMVNGTEIARCSSFINGVGYTITLHGIVPPGATYEVILYSGMTLVQWMEIN